MLKDCEAFGGLKENERKEGGSWGGRLLRREPGVAEKAQTRRPPGPPAVLNCMGRCTFQMGEREPVYLKVKKRKEERGPRDQRRGGEVF